MSGTKAGGLKHRRDPVVRFWEKVNKDGPVPQHRPELGACWEWTACTDGWGYGTLQAERFKALKAHRFSWMLHNGAVPVGMRVLHKCDNPPCVNPAHLFLGTDADNASDRVAKGRCNSVRGERQGKAKLTDEMVRDIRRRVAAGESQVAIARSIGAHTATVNCVVKGRTWRHV